MRFLLIFIILITSETRTLVINTNQSDAEPRAIWDQVFEDFRKENPDVDLRVNYYDHEGYKTGIRNWLATSPPDLVFWYAGNRMRFFARKNLFEPLTQIWEDPEISRNFSKSRAAVSDQGEVWGLPFTFYHWGIYFNQEVFSKLGLKPPQTWSQFKQVCKIVKESGLAPIALGTRYLWPAAGWFDYVNLRVNGLEFHLELLEGKVPFKDQRVKAAMSKLVELARQKYFLDYHATYSWQEAQAFLYQGKAAMVLMGNFMTASIPKNSSIGFFRVPQIRDDIPFFEDAPMDTLHIPQKATNKKDAYRFIKFVARAKIQTRLNLALNQLPPHQEASVGNNVFLQSGAKILRDASATAQFLDRDADPNMGRKLMKAIQEILIKPDNLEKVLNKLEIQRLNHIKFQKQS